MYSVTIYTVYVLMFTMCMFRRSLGRILYLSRHLCVENVVLHSLHRSSTKTLWNAESFSEGYGLSQALMLFQRKSGLLKSRGNSWVQMAEERRGSGEQLVSDQSRAGSQRRAINEWSWTTPLAEVWLLWPHWGKRWKGGSSSRKPKKLWRWQ